MSERPILDAIKVQSKVVIPIVKALEREIGKARTSVAGDAIAAYVQYRERRGFEPDQHPSVEVDGPAFPVERATATTMTTTMQTMSRNARLPSTFVRSVSPRLVR